MTFDATTAGLILAWVALFVLVLAFAGLLRQIRLLEVAVRNMGSWPGTESGMRHQLPAEVFTDGYEQAVLLFVDPSCTSCYPVLTGANELARRFPSTRVVLVPLSGTVGFDDPGEVLILDGVGSTLASALSVPAAPYGVLMSSNGTELSRAPVGSQAQFDLLVSSSAPTTPEGVIADGIHA